MNDLHFATNPNGKLFLEYFSIVQPEDDVIFYTGARFEIFYKSVHFGTAEVVAIRGLEYRWISDVLAYIENGTPCHIYGKQLAIVHGTSGRMDATEKLVHLVLHYTWINTDSMGTELHEWWRERFQAFHPQENQNAL